MRKREAGKSSDNYGLVEVEEEDDDVQVITADDIAPELPDRDDDTGYRVVGTLE